MGYLTLSQLQQRIKQTIELNVRAEWVLCDISDIKVNGSGHCYLEIVEKSEGRGAIPKAKATAIIWRTTYQLIEGYFFKQTGIKLSAGLKVMLMVEVNYHELYGLSLVVKDIDPTYSLGDMEKMRRETIEQLRRDGVMDMNRELELSPVIHKIAVISSKTAAGYGDFCNHLSSNDYGYTFDISLFEAVVQGDFAEESIINSMMRIVATNTLFDAVVIIRGGGSQSDLSCFNNYQLCSYIAQFPIPILTGIGHDKDLSVADMVAHSSFKTPTAVANFIIDTKKVMEDLLDSYQAKLDSYTSQYISTAKERLTSLSSALRLYTMQRVSQESVKLERSLSVIEHGTTSIISTHFRRCDDYYVALKNGVASLVREQQHRLALWESRIDGYNPQHILKQGYSMAYVDGRVVKSVSDVSAGDRMQVRVADGVIESVVK